MFFIPSIPPVLTPVPKISISRFLTPKEIKFMYLYQLPGNGYFWIIQKSGGLRKATPKERERIMFFLDPSDYEDM